MLFRPSKSGYWSNCAAYVSFTKDYPDQTNDAAREGTAIMSVIESVINGDAHDAIDYEGETHRNGWLITKDMCHDAQDFIDWLRAFHSAENELIAEQPVIASNGGNGEPHITGTLDVRTIAYDHPINGDVQTFNLMQPKTFLHVIDFKYGYRTVEVKNNPQLINYAYGEAKRIGWQGPIKIWIYQPRVVHRHGVARSQTFEGEHLSYAFEKLRNMALEGMKPNPLATPGPHCRDCEVATKCVALRETCRDFVDAVQSRETHDMNGEEIARELKFIDTVKPTIDAYFNAVTTEAEERIKNENIPGWQATPKYGHRKFKAEPITILMSTGIDPYEKKVCTPAEIERRLVKSGKSKQEAKELVAPLTTTPITGMKLHRIDEDDVSAMFKGK